MATIDNALGYQQAATDQASALNRDIYDDTRSMQMPYIQAGASQIPGLVGSAGQAQAGQQYMDNLEGLDPRMNSDYGSLLQDPGYQFVNQQAQEMGERQLAGWGMTGSRPGFDMMADVGRQTAISERDRFDRMNQGNYDRQYGQQADLYNMANQGQGNRYNRQMQLAGMGQNSAANFGNTGANFARGQSDLYTGMANAQASGMLSNDAMQANQQQDQNNMWAGLAGTALSSQVGQDAIGSAWDTVSGWF